MEILKMCLLLGLFNALPFVLQAQTSFAPLGATWTYSFADHVPLSYTYRPFELSVNAEELFQGRMCGILDLMNVPPYGTWHGFWMDSLFLYEENDSVYFWSPYSQKFQLLYDFTAEVGDSWVIGGLSVPDHSIYEDFLTVTVDSIRTLISDGDTVRVWYHEESMYFDWGNAIIEGVGSNGFMLPSFGLYESRLGTMRCYNDMESNYQFVHYPCDTVILNPIGVGTGNTLEEIRIVLSPNPVEHILQITSSEQIQDGVLRIFDFQGHLLREEKITVPGSYDVSKLAAGVYLCNVVLDSHGNFNQRIVKLP